MLSQEKLIAFDDLPEKLTLPCRKLIEQALLSTGASNQPRLIHLCGIPGAGKSTYAASLHRQLPDFALVQFDAIMESLPEYQQEKAVYGALTAFANWEKSARSIGYHLLQALLEKRRNVIFDHSAANAAHLQLIAGAKTWGYQVEMHYLPCSISVALKRVQVREKITQRHTPKTLLSQRQEALRQLLPPYQQQVHRFVEVPADWGCIGQTQLPISVQPAILP